MFNIDFDDEHADWPKRTPDRRADLVPAEPAQYDLRHLPGQHDQASHGHGRVRLGGSGLFDSVRGGGATIDVYGGPAPTTGFVVSRPSQAEHAPGVPNGRIVPEDEFFGDAGPGILADYVTARADAFRGGAKLGIWHDTEHGEVALDLVEVVDDRAAALQLGRDNDQQAIYDVAAGEVLDTGGTGGRDDLAGRSSGRWHPRGDGSLGEGAHRLDEAGVHYDLRHLAGQHDQMSHAHGGSTMSPGMQGPTKDKTKKDGTVTPGRKKNPVDGPDGTDLHSLPTELQDKMLGQVRDAYPHLGDDPVDAMATNIKLAYDEAGEGPVATFGEAWYGMAHNTANEIAAESGLTLEQSTGVLAALSPRTGWEANVEWGHHVARMVKNDDVITDEFLDKPVTKSVFGADGKSEIKTMTAREWATVEGHPLTAGKRLSELEIGDQMEAIRLAGQVDDGKIRITQLTTTGQAGKEVGAAPPFGTNIEAAIRIARGDASLDSVSAELNGHKVRSFYNDIVTAGTHPTAVTIDTHALDAAIIGPDATRNGQKTLGSDDGQGGTMPDPAKVMSGGPSKTEYGVSDNYPVFAEAFREATRRVNAERAQSGRPALSVSQVQAVAWIVSLRVKPGEVE